MPMLKSESRQEGSHPNPRYFLQPARTARSTSDYFEFENEDEAFQPTLLDYAQSQ
ncbi:hypothetical protein SERLADRAFT_458441 [Serpula lacrymans var. lacrymans S7.9]|uniref:Uncharacterized protein n=1 Tax=Serpula lacrymans var. lacrymans (strain S7.9) TaxID=578457 RepID=F8NIT9_SERL9|nr:uncharacterized protein SERLADRAFT_458441 [Serpula lacrymans var. lacrymans S7.9]EGO30004.1 hypothetical protein SERLADRAFT_458441 [Serpula lacrymans var. lacrymans S7.9]